MLRELLPLAMLPAFLLAGERSAADLARAVRDAGLDASECYRVRDLNFNKDDLKFYLTDGFLIFAKPVDGRRIAAVFSADVEGGDGELILMPPHRSERQSLAAYTGAPNLDEHFHSALFLLPAGLAEDLFARAQRNGRKQPERGVLMEGQFSSVVRNIAESLQMRLVEDLLSPLSASAIFYGAIGGDKLGNFDVIADPKSQEQILVGQFSTAASSPGFDVWASFESRPVRTGGAKRVESPFAVSDYRIDVSLDDHLHLAGVTRVKLTPSRDTRAFPFQVSDRVAVKEARIDGQPVELFQRESLRDTAIRGAGTNIFLAVTHEPLHAGKTYEVEFRQEGDVVFKAGNGVYAVGARGTWYPHRGAEFTTYDLTFRYPKRLTLVSTGEVVDDHVEGGLRITHRRTSAPVRFVGFNLGDYERVAMNRGGYTIEVYGNRTLEQSLTAKPVLPLPPLQPPIRRRDPGIPTFPTMPSQAQPSGRLGPLAEEVAGAFEFMVKLFGPPPLKTLTITPIPGAFGQGFPGLVYLSTLSYLKQDERPAGIRDQSRQAFFSDLLAPHEVAHQWWGNLVTSESYQDTWLNEALANYSALIYIEKRKGARAVEAMLSEYRDHLLAKGADGKTVESAGPITWGARLQSSARAAASWRTIEYEKGAWIVHMLRLRMGDERFFRMLNELCRRYAFKPVSTESFRALAEEFMPADAGKGSLEGFFESWVYGTGIPSLKVTAANKGKAPAIRVTASVTQTEVDEDFIADVPVELQYPSGPPLVKWIRTSSEPVSFTVNSKRIPARVIIPPAGVLARK